MFKTPPSEGHWTTWQDSKPPAIAPVKQNYDWSGLQFAGDHLEKRDVLENYLGGDWDENKSGIVCIMFREM